MRRQFPGSKNGQFSTDHFPFPGYFPYFDGQKSLPLIYPSFRVLSHLS